MMEYRKLPHGEGNEIFSVLGLGMGGIQKCSEDEIEKVIRKAIKHGINFFDLCAGGRNVYTPFGRAITGQRDKVFLQLHFRAVYNSNGDYRWSRNLNEIKNTFS
jgi:predicted aldo/keto reductase-like oxidoreductase